MATYRSMSNDHDVPFLADEDLTAKQYTLLRPASTAGYAACANSACSFGVLGVLQNSPSAGQEATVRLMGTTKVYGEANGTCGLAYGGFVFAASTGRVEGYASGCPIIGRWLSAAVTSGDVVGEIFLFPFSACTVAAC